MGFFHILPKVPQIQNFARVRSKFGARFNGTTPELKIPPGVSGSVVAIEAGDNLRDLLRVASPCRFPTATPCLRVCLDVAVVA